MWFSKSSQERKAGGSPDLGNISKILMRVEPSLVSDPRQKGELAESATRSGTRLASAFMARIAASPLGTATWTCRP